jgi:hypothetical protein
MVPQLRLGRLSALPAMRPPCKADPFGWCVESWGRHGQIRGGLGYSRGRKRKALCRFLGGPNRNLEEAAWDWDGHAIPRQGSCAERSSAHHSTAQHSTAAAGRQAGGWMGVQYRTAMYRHGFTTPASLLDFPRGRRLSWPMATLTGRGLLAPAFAVVVCLRCWAQRAEGVHPNRTGRGLSMINERRSKATAPNCRAGGSPVHASLDR